MWDAICADTFCDSHRQASAKEADGAAVHAETDRAKTYAHLAPTPTKPISSNHLHWKPAVWFGPDSMCFLCDLGRRLKSTTGKPNSTYLLQRTFRAIQIGKETFAYKHLRMQYLIIAYDVITGGSLRHYKDRQKGVK